MCCLRYEDEAYTSLRRALPRCGAEVACAGGQGKVVSQDVLRQCVEVRLTGGRRIVCPVGEIEDPEPPDAEEDGPETEAGT
jgi:cell fate regulator YaaT (PSP1 superfamily)